MGVCGLRSNGTQPGARGDVSICYTSFQEKQGGVFLDLDGRVRVWDERSSLLFLEFYYGVFFFFLCIL